MNTPQKLVFLHTSHVLIPLFTDLANRLLPGVEIFHMSDDSLIKNTIRDGKLTENTSRRVAGMVDLARQGGADVVLVTCSSIGRATELAAESRDYPVLRIDVAMAEQAVLAFAPGKPGRLGVAATLSTTLEPTVELLKATAERLGRELEIVPGLAEGAFQAVLAGNTALHDELLLKVLRKLRVDVDVVVLAQASMARVAALLPPHEGAPILSSPERAVQRAGAVLRDLKKRG